MYNKKFGVRKEKENQGRKQRKQPMMQRLETKA